MIETTYVVVQATSDSSSDPVTVLATSDFDSALDSLREHPVHTKDVRYRFMDVWRNGIVKHTLYFDENGLNTARVEQAEPEEAEVAATV